MTDYKMQRAAGKIGAFAKHYGMSDDRIEKEVVGRLFGGDSDPLEAFIDGVHYQRRPGEDAPTFINRVNAAVMKRAAGQTSFDIDTDFGQAVLDKALNDMSIAEVSDYAWKHAKSAEVGGIQIYREPDESAELFRARVEALFDKIDGGLH